MGYLHDNGGWNWWCWYSIRGLHGCHYRVVEAYPPMDAGEAKLLEGVKRESLEEEIKRLREAIDQLRRSLEG